MRVGMHTRAGEGMYIDGGWSLVGSMSDRAMGERRCGAAAEGGGECGGRGTLKPLFKIHLWTAQPMGHSMLIDYLLEGKRIPSSPEILYY